MILIQKYFTIPLPAIHGFCMFFYHFPTFSPKSVHYLESIIISAR